MIIKNPNYNNWNKTNFSKEQKDFMNAVNLGDTAIFTYWGTVDIGEVRLISYRGINISTPWGDKFIKWYHVKEIEKT